MAQGQSQWPRVTEKKMGSEKLRFFWRIVYRMVRQYLGIFWFISYSSYGEDEAKCKESQKCKEWDPVSKIQ